MNQNQVRELNAAIEAVKGYPVENVYFVACGGSKAIFDPAQYIFDRETTIPSFVYTANEFVHRCPKGLGEKSLVITCSHSGNTPETVRATALAGEKGALTISFAFKTESPLWEATKHGVSYEWGSEQEDRSDGEYHYSFVNGSSTDSEHDPNRYESASHLHHVFRPLLWRGLFVRHLPAPGNAMGSLRRHPFRRIFPRPL